MAVEILDLEPCLNEHKPFIFSICDVAPPFENSTTLIAIVVNMNDQRTMKKVVNKSWPLNSATLISLIAEERNMSVIFARLVLLQFSGKGNIEKE